MKRLLIKNVRGTRGLREKHGVQADLPYQIIERSESGSFYYIANPIYQGENDRRNAAWLAVAKDECIILD